MKVMCLMAALLATVGFAFERNYGAVCMGVALIFSTLEHMEMD